MKYILAALAVALISAATFADEAKRPNIVIILADDLGYADVGFHGCKDIPTPHIDGLAQRGVRFTNGYVSGPYCSPTRAGLLTGRYQTRFGHEFNAGGGDTGLPVSQTTFANYFRAAGYVTGLVGKWPTRLRTHKAELDRAVDRGARQLASPPRQPARRSWFLDLSRRTRTSMVAGRDAHRLAGTRALRRQEPRCARTPRRPNRRSNEKFTQSSSSWTPGGKASSSRNR